MYTPSGRVYDLDGSGRIRAGSLDSRLDRSGSGSSGRSTTLRAEPPREPLVKYTPPTMKSLKSDSRIGSSSLSRSGGSAEGLKGRGDAASLQKSLSELGIGTAMSTDGKRPAIVLYDPPDENSPTQKLKAPSSTGGDDARTFWSNPDGTPVYGDDDDDGGFDDYGDPPQTHYDDEFYGDDYDDRWEYGHPHGHHWFWWDEHCYDWHRASYGWHDWCFSFRYFGRHSSHFWFSFSFGFGDRFHFYHHPWRHYSLHYGHCYVSYHRPWRYWHRTYYRPFYRSAYSYRPWYRRAYFDDYDYYYDDYWYDEPTTHWYVTYRSTQPVFIVLDEDDYRPALPSVDTGWSLLSEGALDGAIDVFSELIYALPSEGEARIGYALSVGLQGRDAAAITAMRQALRDDPEALFDVPRDERLLAKLEVLLDRYSSLVREDFRDVDALFMTAALRFMLDEHATAYFAVDAAIRNGDADPSSENLKRLLDRVMSELF